MPQLHLQPQPTVTVLCGAELVLTRGDSVTCAVFQAMDALPDIGFPLAVDSQQPQKLTVCIYGGGVAFMGMGWRLWPASYWGCAQSDGPATGLLKGDATM